jgi:hypothetical protein
MLDNIERIDSDYSDRESREVAHQAEIHAANAWHRDHRVQQVMADITKLGNLSPVELDQVLMTVAASTGNTVARELIELCVSEVECVLS